MKKTMTAIEELHAIREQLLAEAGGTLAGLVAQLRADQKASGREIIRRPSAETASISVNEITCSESIKSPK